MPSPYGKASADEHARFVLERCRHLPREPGLADAGWPERGDEVTGSIGQRLVEGGADAGELLAPAHERGVEPAREGRGAFEDANEAVGGDWVRLPLQLERLDGLHLDRVTGEA